MSLRPWRTWVSARLLRVFTFRPFVPYLAHLDLTFADLEPVWGYLGPSWAHFGAILEGPSAALDSLLFQLVSRSRSETAS